MKPALNTWYHVAFIRDTKKGQVRLQVRDENRKLLSSLSYPYGWNSVATSTRDLIIGEGFNGYIDEVRISNIVRDYRSLSVTSPAGGEQLKAGNTYPIVWTSQDIQNLKLEYSTNNGTSWNVIAGSVAAASGTYGWTIPNLTSTNCKVRISDQTDASFFAVSDSAFAIQSTSSVEGWSNGVPDSYELYQNFPNPFNPVSRIRYQLPKQTPVRIALYDVLGKEVKRLVDDVRDAGYYELELNGGDLGSGIYFLKMNAEGHSSVRKIMLMK
jgi:hypothetical protein